MAERPAGKASRAGDAEREAAPAAGSGAQSGGAPRLVLRRHPEAARITVLRARLLSALRACLDGAGFVEADVPGLLPHAGQEAHLHPPVVALDGLPGPLWLQTSPELCLKRLVCAGLPRVYALGPAYRGGREEVSRLHQPQFCLLEWYRPGTRVEDLIADVRRFGEVAAGALGVAPPAAGRALSLREAFAGLAGVPLEPLLDGDVPAFARAARAAGVASCQDTDAAPTAFARVLLERVEPALAGLPGWTFLHDFPAFGAALAQLSPDDPRVALRVEAYLGGLEIANGYVELADPREHRERWAAERAARAGGPEPATPLAPVDAGFLADLEAPGLPPSVGMALGVDRLLLALAVGPSPAPSLADVLAFRLELER